MVDLFPQQAFLQRLHHLLQLCSEDPGSEVRMITCILAVHFRMVSDLRPVGIASDRDEVRRLPKTSHHGQAIRDQLPLLPG